MANADFPHGLKARSEVVLPYAIHDGRTTSREAISRPRSWGGKAISEHK
jgi:hypothetical protein